MRHLLANLFTFALIATLVVGAVLVAWARSEQLVLSQRSAVEPRVFAGDGPPEVDDWFAFGRRTYRANCQNCHTVDGSGRGMYPPIQGLTPLLDAPGGRDYLVHTLIYGVYSGAYGAPMPPMPELSDTEIAAVLNYVLVQFAAPDQAPGSDGWYRPQEVAALRGRDYDEWAIGAGRPAVPTARELGKGIRIQLWERLPAVPAGEDE
ncbi:cytochrome c [Neolewinella lacunae]|uniref:Cytochrome c n=1 Tax=Neolewinella lacunae TaxID=1517758 RepID=A0A923PGH2_9BACT|nr:cytochrome c [Neolewinella lacunae]MBC6992834.1 cytochrome c [Neolewinella lacunae]MDN3633861.1 cytochrome c [Neolewinella lacunae]